VTIVNLRLSSAEREQLDTAARDRSLSRSELIRQAIAAYLAPPPGTPNPHPTEDLWEDFGAEIIHAHKTVLKDMIDRLDETSWADSVETLYKLFRAKTVEATLAYQNPALFTSNREAPFEPRIVSAIGFAADDIAEISLPLEQFFFEYLWHAGPEAFDEIPAIWSAAKKRASTGKYPSLSDCLAAGTVRS